MAWRCTWKVTCDLCKTAGPGCYQGRTPGHDAEQKAVKRGWVSQRASYYGGQVHLCPDCAKLPRPDWWPKTEES